ncbi:G-protein coupled receptor 20-like [Oryzias latipes]|uniref:G protein-coupled receptor 20 n=1 Tax=Oryzias latipes TaxID=8090 RepID=A0A3B3HYR6_ORYLA|nr:G-protein coupled receptor 20-like [Oryzias latipes]
MQHLLININSIREVHPPLFTPQLTNCSAPDRQWAVPDMHRLAHLDIQLYQDFYGVWVTLMVFNCLMLVVGVVLNSLALYIFCGASTRSSSSVVYTINLAVADLLVALSLPARIALYHSGGGCVACSYVHTFSYFVNMYCSILFLTSICVDRYLAVVHTSGSLHRWRTTGTAKAISASVWLIAVVVTYSCQTTALSFSSACSGLPAHFYLTVLEFVLPMLAIVGFTLRLACFLSSRKGLMPQQSRARRTRAIRLLATVLVVFTVCFTPFHLRQVLVYFQLAGGGGQWRGAEPVLAYHITVSLSSLNSCLDPVVYCFVTDSFRRMWRSRRRGEWHEEVGNTSGGEGERTLVKKCSSTALAIAQSVAALTFSGATLPTANADLLGLEGPLPALEEPPSALEGPPSALEGPPSALEGPPSALEEPPSALEGPPSALEGPPSALEGPPICSWKGLCLLLESPAPDQRPPPVEIEGQAGTRV